MNKPNMSISYGGESAKQQKSNLMKDNPVAKHASATQMKQPGYMSADQANNLPPELVKAISKDEKDKGKTQPLNNRKIKKAAKTQAQIDKIRNSFGTKDADVSGRFDRKRKKMDKTVSQLEKKGINVDFDTTSAEGEGKSRKTTKKTSYVSGKSPASMIEEPKKKMLKARITKKMSCAPGYKKVGEQCIPIKTESAKKKQPTKMYKKH